LAAQAPWLRQGARREIALGMRAGGIPPIRAILSRQSIATARSPGIGHIRHGDRRLVKRREARSLPVAAPSYEAQPSGTLSTWILPGAPCGSSATRRGCCLQPPPPAVWRRRCRRRARRRWLRRSRSARARRSWRSRAAQRLPRSHRGPRASPLLRAARSPRVGVAGGDPELDAGGAIASASSRLRPVASRASFVAVPASSSRASRAARSASARRRSASIARPRATSDIVLKMAATTVKAASATQLRLSAVVKRPTGGMWKKLKAAALANEVARPRVSPQ
jgi:hypothetical protein